MSMPLGSVCSLVIFLSNVGSRFLDAVDGTWEEPPSIDLTQIHFIGVWVTMDASSTAHGVASLEFKGVVETTTPPISSRSSETRTEAARVAASFCDPG
ncbi:hypothetical protein AAHE18_11G154900 [Arachis hypogaea]